MSAATEMALGFVTGLCCNRRHMGSQSDDSKNPDPITITMSSALGTGPGTIETAPGRPNVQAIVVPWYELTLARGMDAFLTTLLSAVGVGGPTGLLPAKDFMHLLINSAGISLGAGCLALLYDGQKQLRKFIASHP